MPTHTHTHSLTHSLIYQESISSTFYSKLLCGQIPKAPKKNTVKLSVFFILLGFACVKATCKHVGEIDPISHLKQSFTVVFDTNGTVAKDRQGTNFEIFLAKNAIIGPLYLFLSYFWKILRID